MKKDSEFPVMTTTNGNGNGNDNNDQSVQVLEFPDQVKMLDRSIEKIMQMPPELRTEFDYNIAWQGANISIPASGRGEILVSGPKFQLLISPVKKNDH